MTEHTPTPLRDLALGTAMPETEHSPIPWQISDSGYVVAECIPVRGQSLAIRATDDRHGMQDEAAANAAFIVKAVNNHDALVEFFRWAMREGPWDGGDLDGASVQDKAESLGLIVKTQYDAEKHGVQSDFETGDDWFEYAPDLRPPAPVGGNAE